jgi:adenylate kinase family enzyme
MNDILTDKSKILGEIYIIRNVITNMNYIGQTVSHRKNHQKYRPFGYVGRFKDHISEAICNTKKNQCWYLNNAIRHYGKEAFAVELIHVCNVNELDTWEKHFIIYHNTLYPNGYNLTGGGQTLKCIPSDTCNVNTSPLNTSRKRGGCINRSEDTCAIISKRLKQYNNSEEVRHKHMKRTQEQHAKAKIERFKGVSIDINNYEKYIHICNSKIYGKYIRVVIEYR